MFKINSVKGRWHSLEANERPGWACLSWGSGHMAQPMLVLCAIGHHLVANVCTDMIYWQGWFGLYGGPGTPRKVAAVPEFSWWLGTSLMVFVIWGRWTGRYCEQGNSFFIFPLMQLGSPAISRLGFNLLSESCLPQERIRADHHSCYIWIFNITFYCQHVIGLLFLTLTYSQYLYYFFFLIIKTIKHLRDKSVISPEQWPNIWEKRVTNLTNASQPSSSCARVE